MLRKTRSRNLKNNVAESAIAITIYSTASPGAISPDQYRGRGGQAPGYAVVRQERPVTLDKGKTTVRFTDVAALIDPEGRQELYKLSQVGLRPETTEVAGPVPLEVCSEPEPWVKTYFGYQSEIVPGASSFLASSAGEGRYTLAMNGALCCVRKAAILGTVNEVLGQFG